MGATASIENNIPTITLVNDDISNSTSKEFSNNQNNVEISKPNIVEHKDHNGIEIFKSENSLKRNSSQSLLKRTFTNSWLSIITDSQKNEKLRQELLLKDPTRLIVSLKGHLDVILTIIELSDGNVATGSKDKTIKIWLMKEENFGKCLKTLSS